MPFTLRDLKDDLEDLASRFDGAPALEFRAATASLGLEQSGLTSQRVPPGYRMKLDDEIVELVEWDAVRVPPGTWRGYEPGPHGLELLVVGAPNLGAAPREDVGGRRDLWAD